MQPVCHLDTVVLRRVWHPSCQPGRAMAQVPDVRAIVDQIKARIADIEEQLKQHRDLSDELDRLRGALGRLEGDVTARVRGRRAPAKPSSSRRRTASAKSSTSATAAPVAEKPRRPRTAALRGQT